MGREPELLTTKARILLYLESHGPARGTKIAKALGVSLSAVYAALRELRAAGLVEYNDLVYSITEEGRRAIQRLRDEVARAELASAPSA